MSASQVIGGSAVPTASVAINVSEVTGSSNDFLTLHTTQLPGGAQGVVVVADISGSDASLYLQSQASGDTNSWRWRNPGTSGGGFVAGNLYLQQYLNGALTTTSLNVRAANGAVQFPAVQAATASIASGSTATAAIPVDGLTATSVVLVTQLNAPTNAQTGPPYVLINAPADTFTINCSNDPGVSGVTYSWFVAKL